MRRSRERRELRADALGSAIDTGRNTITELDFDQFTLFSRFWRCALGFWQDRDCWHAWLIVGCLACIVLLQLCVQYALNFWNRDFFDALGRRDGTALLREGLTFLPLAGSSVLLAVAGVWGRMKVQRDWRAWLSRYLINYWTAEGHPRRLRFMMGEHHNPEYRIAEDARGATEPPVDLVFGLATSLLTGLTFIGVLWTVGGSLAITVFDHELIIHGYLVVAAIFYSGLVTASMMFIGRRLTAVIGGKNQAEAEFRSIASRLRQRGDAPTSQNGPNTNRNQVLTALDQVIDRWRDLGGQLMRITLVTQSNFLLSPVVGLIIATPKYLNGAMSLGEITQSAAAFVMVQAAFNWLGDNYQRLADWTSSINRVSALLLSLDRVEKIDPSP
jgi:putative ATP-binding cassette transporter